MEKCWFLAFARITKIREARVFKMKRDEEAEIVNAIL